MLDLFCGRWGWAKAFAARGWECVGVDLIEPPETPANCTFIQLDILEIPQVWSDRYDAPRFDFICASPPCEQFSVHGMKHFHPSPPWPGLGIKLFAHTQKICIESGIPFVIENVRAAQQFVGNAVHHCGPFYLWGTGVPPLMNQNIKKMMRGNGTAWKQYRHLPIEDRRLARNEHQRKYPLNKIESASQIASIPSELSNCVADYAERILEVAQ